MFNTATKAQMQELIEYIASKMSVIDVSTIADANNVEEGYFNETDSKFYEEANYTTEITGKSKTIYISLNTDLPYYFNGSTFTALSSPQQQITVDSSLDNTSENPIQNKAVTKALDDKQDALDAGDGIDITDNTISIDEMPAEDMNEIIPQLPPIRNNRMKYSTEEQIIGEWIDGKPIYQKTIDFGHSLTDTSDIQQEWLEPVGASIDRVINVWANIYNEDNIWGSSLPWCNESSYVTLGAYNNNGADTTKKNKVGIYWKGSCAWITDPIITIQYTKTTD